MAIGGDDPYLEVVSGPGAGSEYDLDGSPTVVGRGLEADVQIEDRSASRKHFRVWLDRGVGWRLQDLDSGNGVKVNGQPARRTQLKDGDVILVGATKLRFHLGSGGGGGAASDDVTQLRDAGDVDTVLPGSALDNWQAELAAREASPKGGGRPQGAIPGRSAQASVNVPSTPARRRAAEPPPTGSRGNGPVVAVIGLVAAAVIVAVVAIFSGGDDPVLNEKTAQATESKPSTKKKVAATDTEEAMEREPKEVAKESPAPRKKKRKLRCSRKWSERCEVLGHKALKDKNFGRAIKLSSKACKSGSGGACLIAGLALGRSSSSPDDRKKAVKLLEKACGHGVDAGCEAIAEFEPGSRGTVPAGRPKHMPCMITGYYKRSITTVYTLSYDLEGRLARAWRQTLTGRFKPGTAEPKDNWCRQLTSECLSYLAPVSTETRYGYDDEGLLTRVSSRHAKRCESVGDECEGFQAPTTVLDLNQRADGVLLSYWFIHPLNNAKQDRTNGTVKYSDDGIVTGLSRASPDSKSESVTFVAPKRVAAYGTGVIVWPYSISSPYLGWGRRRTVGKFLGKTATTTEEYTFGADGRIKGVEYTYGSGGGSSYGFVYDCPNEKTVTAQRVQGRSLDPRTEDEPVADNVEPEVAQVETEPTHEVYGTVDDPDGDAWLALKGRPKSSSSKTLAKMPDGTKLEVISKNHGKGDRWFKVRVVGGVHAGTVGYAHSTWVRKIGERGTLDVLKDIRRKLRSVTDGYELAVNRTGAVAYDLKVNDLKYKAISKMPRGSYAEAMKDMDSERGKAKVVFGRVIEITKDGSFFKGLMCGNRLCTKLYYFVTAGTTKGVTEGKSRMFAGVLAQRYSYRNSGGGTSHSLVLVGYFKGQK